MEVYGLRLTYANGTHAQNHRSLPRLQNSLETGTKQGDLSEGNQRCFQLARLQLETHAARRQQPHHTRGLGWALVT